MYPVGEGAKRVRTVISTSPLLLILRRQMCLLVDGFHGPIYFIIFHRTVFSHNFREFAYKERSVDGDHAG
jgi:hypothetical protein